MFKPVTNILVLVWQWPLTTFIQGRIQQKHYSFIKYILYDILYQIYQIVVLIGENLGHWS